jgi:hypothetical protein
MGYFWLISVLSYGKIFLVHMLLVPVGKQISAWKTVLLSLCSVKPYVKKTFKKTSLVWLKVVWLERAKMGEETLKVFKIFQGSLDFY